MQSNPEANITFSSGLIHHILPNLLELTYSMLLSVLPVPIDNSTMSSFGNNLLALAYAQAAGLLANTPPSINSLSLANFQTFWCEVRCSSCCSSECIFQLNVFFFPTFEEKFTTIVDVITGEQ